MIEFKIRSSAISQIMSEPRSKKDKEAGVLSQTTKSYVHQWIIENRYRRRKELDNKYVRKGNVVEEQSIKLLSEYENTFYSKNEEYFEHYYLTGTPDIVFPELIDIKSSWDLFTFPHFEEELPNKAYYWQMQGYMALTGLKTARVVYVLANTPYDLYQRDMYHICKSKGIELTPEIENELLSNYVYDDIPINERIKSFTIERNNDDIKKIELRVQQIRNYIGGLK